MLHRTRKAVRYVGLKMPIYVVFAVALVATGMLTYWVGQQHSRPPDGFSLPRQIVLSRVPGIVGPAVRSGDAVIVHGTKCNTTNEVLVADGVVSWNSVSPPGVQVAESAGGGSVFGPHECKTATFYNPMPDAVVQATQTLQRFHRGPIMWSVVGSITADGFANQEWVSQAFQVVPS